MTTSLDVPRSSLASLRALGFCQLADSPALPELKAFKAWLSTWSGIGHIVVGDGAARIPVEPAPPRR
jgi:hypothetical protein